MDTVTTAAPAQSVTARGELRVYLGAAPGVGKTFAMLNEGRRRRDRGEDVVVGFVEPHGRRRTVEQVGDLEVVPRRTLTYRGAAFEEMDLQALLDRHPDLALVDELAHTNVPGSANEKRWQDIEDLLAAGIGVISTVNIQHLASLNDVVERITGVTQRETVPDEVVRRADQLELIDHPPETIRARLARGDIYPAERIDTALGNYFRPGNLAALRELALLWIADRVEEELDEYRRRHGISDTWETRERVLVALDGTPQGDRLIRRAARMAQRLNGDLVAVHVTPQDGLVTAHATLDRERRLVEQLGGTYREVAGAELGPALVDTARSVNATQLVVGATHHSPLWSLLHGSTVAGIIRAAGPVLDIHVISRTPTGEERERQPGRRRLPGLSRRRLALGFAFTAVGLPLLTWILSHVRAQIGLQGVLMAFLLLVVGASAIGGMGPAIATAVGGFLLVNWYFTPPLYAFTIGEPENIAALIFFLTVAIVVSVFVSLASRRAAEGARLRADAGAMALLAGSPTVDELLDSLWQSFECRGISLLHLDGGSWRVRAARGEPPPTATGEITLQVDPAHTLVIHGRVDARTEDRRMLDAYARRLAAAIGTEQLEQAASQADALESADQLRSAILAAVSHDLRTPLAAIKASASSLRQEDVEWSPADRRELIETIDDEADRLNALVGNLLDMSRVQAGALEIALRPVSLDEVLPAALSSVGGCAANVRLELREDLPPVLADRDLLERALANIIANAIAYSPDGRPAHVFAGRVDDLVDIRVADRGPGVPTRDRERMFLPFQRTGDSDRREGAGVGLAVARGVVLAMGGSIETEDTPGGGLTVVVRIHTA